MATKARMTKDKLICLDGVESKQYKKGEILHSNSGHSERVIRHVIQNGDAEEITTSQLEKEKQQGKAKAAPKTKTAKTSDTDES